MSVDVARPQTLLFIGDSVTDSGWIDDPEDWGNGYVREVAAQLRAAHPGSGIRVVNRGTGGDRVRDLRARWDADCLAVVPDIVSVLIGANDTWRRFDADDPTSAADYERDYEHILARACEETTADLVLIEPFVVPVRPEQWLWRQDLDERIQVTRQLAERFDAVLVAADGMLAALARQLGDPRIVTDDGIHPSKTGHEALATLWLEQAGCPVCSAAPGTMVHSSTS